MTNKVKSPPENLELLFQQWYNKPSAQNPCGYMEGELLCQAGVKQGFTGKNRDLWQGLLRPGETEGTFLP